jgi:N-acetylmuramoyl-L-alanine amidase
MISEFVNKIAVKILICVQFLLMFTQLAYATTNVKEMRVGNQTSGARIVFDMDADISYRAFLLTDPQRLVIDLDDANISNIFTKVKNNTISKARVGKLDGNNKRVVLDLSQPAIIKKAFVLPPQSGLPWRLVVDVQNADLKAFNSKLGNKNTITNNSKFSPKDESVSEKKVAQNNNTSGKSAKQKKVIVLDPGHGGKDPGAIGAYSKTYEKNITLAMAKELKDVLRQKGYTVYLTREKDVFIPLRKRTKIAQQYKADLFVSIHADSAKNKNAKGLSVYTLSDKASDAEAAALAERENKADIIGGVNLGGNSKEVNDILISLSQTDSRNKSSKYATYLVKEMAKSTKLLKNTHRFAGFAVLKAPDIPSVLLEMGYLSNRSEEANLRKSAYRKKLAVSTANAVERYFSDPEIASN